jgi:hypothetical protein
MDAIRCLVDGRVAAAAALAKIPNNFSLLLQILMELDHFVLIEMHNHILHVHNVELPCRKDSGLHLRVIISFPEDPGV